MQPPSTKLRLLPLPLLPKNASTHLQHGLKPLPPPSRILTKPLHTRLLDLRPDLLPPPTQRRDLRILRELCSLVARRRGAEIRLVGHGFADPEDVGPGEVGAAHGDAFFGGRDVGCFVDVGGVGAAEEGDDPGGGLLVACY